MHLLIVMAFGLLIWRSDQQLFAPPVQSTALSVAVVMAQTGIWWLAARACSAYALRHLRAGANGVDAAQLAYHRSSFWLRLLVLVGFAADLFLTRWAQIIESIGLIPRWSAIADFIVISPFLIALLAVWHAQFPIDRALRDVVAKVRKWEDLHHGGAWNLRQYLSFNVRYHMLTVVVPLTVVLLAYRLCTYHRSALVEALWFPWVPNAILALAAAATFVVAPVLLKSIWATRPLEAGALRRRLESAMADRRTGLRCRDILVWNTYGMMINAAVMGVFARFRYVLLSDGLLEGLSEDEIEAVFGHETGHVRHHHLPYFLLFAVASILLVSGVMEIVIRFSHGSEPVFTLGETATEGIGLGLIAVVWGVAFGWLSRRFERQSDVFGAHCVSSAQSTCGEACGVHPRRGVAPAQGHAVCVAAAKLFVAALDRVAALNGIPLEERNWRHSSIASRMRFLMAQAGDPAKAEAFHRSIRNIKRTLWVVVVVGLIVAAAYSLSVPDYRELIWQNTLGPLRGGAGY